MSAISKTLLLVKTYTDLVVHLRPVASPAIDILYRQQMAIGNRPLSEFQALDSSPVSRAPDPIAYAEACIKRNCYAYIKALEKIIRDRLVAIRNHNQCYDDDGNGVELNDRDYEHLKQTSSELLSRIVGMPPASYDKGGLNDNIGRLVNTVSVDVNMAIRGRPRMSGQAADTSALVLSFMNKLDSLLEAAGGATVWSRYIPIMRAMLAIATLYNLTSYRHAMGGAGLQARHGRVLSSQKGITDTVLAMAPLPTPDIVMLLAEDETPTISNSGYAYIRAATSFASNFA